MKIIAKRGLFKAIIGGAFAFFSLNMLVCAVCFYLFPETPDEKTSSIYYLVMFIIALPPAIYFYIQHYKVPKYIIWYQDGVYHFPDFECKSDFIKNASYVIKYSYDGHLTVITRDGQEHLYKHVQDVPNAHYNLLLNVLNDEGYLHG